MDLIEAMRLFEEAKRRIQNYQNDLCNSEFRTRILLIDPVLRLLGWDVENPDLVVLEYQPAASNRRLADYVLKNNGDNVAIVEAKNTNTRIDDLEHREQADNYARYAEVRFFVLTNGVTWLLYKRDLMTSLESLLPIVRFDVVHDEPYQCALAALSMWRPNLVPDSGPPSEAAESVFISPNLAQERPSSESAEQTEQQLTDSSLQDFEERYTLISERRFPRHATPTRLEIGDDVEEEVNSWLDVIHEVVAWLVGEEILRENDCPISANKYTFIGREAVNPDGTAFIRPRSLPNGLVLQRGLTTVDQWQRLRKLLQQLEAQRNVDPSQIRVFYESTGQNGG